MIMPTKILLRNGMHAIVMISGARRRAPGAWQFSVLARSLTATLSRAI